MIFLNRTTYRPSKLSLGTITRVVQWVIANPILDTIEALDRGLGNPYLNEQKEIPFLISHSP